MVTKAQIDTTPLMLWKALWIGTRSLTVAYAANPIMAGLRRALMGVGASVWA